GPVPGAVPPASQPSPPGRRFPKGPNLTMTPAQTARRRALATLGQIVDSLEAALFTGREREMTVLRAWLRDTTSALPRIVNVTGPAGMGKTALVRALHREAVGAGREGAVVDLGSIGPSPDGLLAE